MKFSLSYTYNDLFQSYYLHSKHSIFKWVARILGGFVFFIGLWGILANQIDFWSISNLVLGCTMLFYRQFMVRFIAFIRYQRNLNLYKDLFFAVNDKGVEVKHKNFSTKYHWESFQNYDLNSQVLILFPSKDLFLILPKRVFKSEQEWQSLLELVNRKIKRK